MKKLLKSIRNGIMDNIPFLITLCLASISLVLWKTIPPSYPVHELISSILAGFIASLCIIVTIDQIQKKKNKKETLPIILSAYEEVHLFTVHLIGLWEQAYAESNTIPEGMTIRDLFTKSTFEKIYNNLDLEGNPNVQPRTNWFSYFIGRRDTIIEEGNHIMDRYISYITPSAIRAIHRLISNNVLLYHLYAPYNCRLADIEEKRPLVTLLSVYYIMPQEEDFALILELIDWCNETYQINKKYFDIPALPKFVKALENPDNSVMTDEKRERQKAAYQVWHEQNN